MSRTRVAVGIVAAGLSLAACTSSGDGSGGSSPPASGTPSPSTSATPPPAPSSTPTPTPSTSAAPSTSASPSGSTASSTPVPSPSATAPAFTTTCTTLTVRVIPGGAIRGAEIAALQYVNDGRSACTVTGVPTAVLLRNGSVIGTPSQPTTTAVTAFTLQPGDVGESLLQDFSNCNAPLSTAVRITTPSRGGAGSATVVRPAKLRACTLRVAPVGPPA